MTTTTGDVITAFDDLGDHTLVTTRALAGIFQVCGRTLRRMEERGDIPPGTGKPKRWFVGDVRNYMADKARKHAEQMQRYRQ